MNVTAEPVVVQDPLSVPEQRAIIDRVLEENQDLPGAPMVILNQLQNDIGYISSPMQSYLAKKLRLPLHQIHGVVTFYSFFTTEPKGKHSIKFCRGTACYVGGASRLIDAARQALGVEMGETTPDGLITLEECRCLGACSQAPVVIVDDTDLYGRVKEDLIPHLIESCMEE